MLTEFREFIADGEQFPHTKILYVALGIIDLKYISSSVVSFYQSHGERIAVPTTSPVHYFRSLRAAKTVFVWKEKLNPTTTTTTKFVGN